VRRRADVLGRFYVLFHETNDRYFAGLLPCVPITIERIARPRVKQGMVGYTVSSGSDGRPLRIVVDEAHALSGSWADVRDTMLHEVVHVWQAQRGERPHHGASFRAMSKRLGISGKAVD
jgi:hypothetical protein